MPAVSNSIHVSIADGVQWVESRGEYVLVDSRNEKIFGIDNIGTEAFRRFTAGQNLEAVRNELVGIYDVEPERLEQDLRALLASLQEHDLIRVQVS